MTEELYLALTAIVDLWEDKKKTIFLGPWCIRFDNQLIAQKMDACVMDTRVDILDFTKIADEYIDFEERFFPALTIGLNKFCGEDHSVAFWKSILYRWLYDYYVRNKACYFQIEDALKAYPNINIPIYEISFEEQEMYINDIQNCEDERGNKYDKYYLMHYTRVLNFFEKRGMYQFRLLYRNSGDKIDKAETRDEDQNFSARVGILQKIYDILTQKNKIAITDVQAGNGRTFLLKNIQYIKFLETMPSALVRKSRNFRMRKQLEIQMDCKNCFEEYLLENIVYDLPVSCIEAYSGIQKYITSKYGGYQPTIVVGHLNETPLGICMANWQERGSKVIGMAHSVGEAIIEKCWVLETPVYDKFYIWGKCDYFKYLRCPSFKYLKPQKKKYEKEHILWCMSGVEERRYMDSVAFVGIFTQNDILQKLEVYKEFCVNISEYITKKLICRNRDAWNFGMKEYIHQWNPDIKFDQDVGEVVPQGYGGLLSEKLYNSRIVICNFFETAVFWESISRNIPTFILSPEITQKNREYHWAYVEDYLLRLADAGIWIKTGKEAADFFEKHYDDIEQWWKQEKVQNLLVQLLNKFWKIEENSERWWKKEYRKLLGKIK